MLGMHTIYMDAGSGARRAIPASMIRAVSTQVDLPVIVGGGIRTPDQAYLSAEAGATVIVVGNAIEEDSNLISELSFCCTLCLPDRGQTMSLNFTACVDV